MSQEGDFIPEIVGPSECGLWLRRCRETKNIAPQLLSEKSGVSVQQISNIESGRSRNPRESTMERLARALGEEMPAGAGRKTEQAASIGDMEFIDFDPHREENYPDEPGLYVLYDISDRPVYAGQGQNIRCRLRDNYTRFWFKRPLVETAAYVRIDDGELREKVEKFMIQFSRSNAILNKNYVAR